MWTKSLIYFGGSVLSTITPNGQGGEYTEYHHPDRLGTRLVTNQPGGTSYEQVHLPFGNGLDAESTGATGRRFTSYERSARIGLDYAQNRTYDSKQGRFTQVDPIAMGSVTLSNPQTLNLYAYCTNDPVNYVDPSGLGFFSFLKKLFKWIMVAIAVIVAVITIIAAPATIAGVLGAISAASGAVSSVAGALGYNKVARIFCKRPGISARLKRSFGGLTKRRCRDVHTRSFLQVNQVLEAGLRERRAGVVEIEPRCRQSSHLFQNFKDVHIEHRLPVGSVEPFDKSVLHRAARAVEFELDLVCFGCHSQSKTVCAVLIWQAVKVSCFSPGIQGTYLLNLQCLCHFFDSWFRRLFASEAYALVAAVVR